MSKSFLSWSGIGVLFVILLFANSLSGKIFRHASLDLTADRQYSLSDGTKNILSQIKDPITLKFYYSRTDGAKYPAIKLWGARVGDVLKEYERAANGKLHLEIYDPRPDSEDEDWAQKYGITQIPTRDGENLYLGLAAVNSSGAEQVVPVFDFQRQQYLEYDVTRSLYSLIVEKKPVIGILSSLDIRGSSVPANPTQPESKEPWVVATQLQENNDVRYIPVDSKTFPNDLTTLVVIHPKNLSQETLYAIDHFVMSGGKLFVLVDPYAQADEPPADPQNPMAGLSYDHSSDLNSLLSAWGVTLNKGNVVGDLSISASVTTQRGGQPKNFVSWLLLNRQTSKGLIADADLVTSALDSVLLPWSGSFTVEPKEGVEVTPLLRSTPNSRLLEEKDYRFNGGDPDTMLRHFAPDGESRILAVRIRGKLKSAFPDGMPAAADGQKAIDAEHPKESKGIANVIAVADVDFISDRFSVSVQNIFGAKVASLLNDNLNFFLNGVENLSGSDDLISIRSRGQFARPFTVVQRMEGEAQQRWQMEEMRLQAQLNAANDRLREIQSNAGTHESGKQVVNKAVLEEMKKFRDQKAEAQTNLRVVRRNLRQDIERLGTFLFIANTFFVPILLVLGYVIMRRRPDRSSEIGAKP